MVFGLPVPILIYTLFIDEIIKAFRERGNTRSKFRNGFDKWWQSGLVHCFAKWPGGFEFYHGNVVPVLRQSFEKNPHLAKQTSQNDNHDYYFK